jgi:hypothetical protein
MQMQHIRNATTKIDYAGKIFATRRSSFPCRSRTS